MAASVVKRGLSSITAFTSRPADCWIAFKASRSYHKEMPALKYSAREGIRMTAQVLAKRMRLVRREKPAAPASSRSHPAMPFGAPVPSPTDVSAPSEAPSQSPSANEAPEAVELAAAAAAAAAAVTAGSPLMHDEKSGNRSSK
jgi:hypothetical protein